MTPLKIAGTLFGRLFGRSGFGAVSREAGLKPQPLVMIPGGANAPELGMMPVDMDPAEILTGYAQLKADGIRCFYIDGRLVSREGVTMDCALQALPGLLALEHAMGRKMVFDGEYVEEDGFDATARAFRRGTGEGVFWIIDAVPFDEWLVDKCTQEIDERWDRLLAVADEIDSPFVGFLTPMWLDTTDKVCGMAFRLWDLGYEGLVMKRKGSLYRRSKSDDWQRWKKLVTADCQLIDVLEKGGILKGIMVRGPDGHPLKVTSGLKQSDLPALRFNIPPVVEISFNQKAGSTKPRHARFNRLRPDKEKANG